MSPKRIERLKNGDGIVIEWSGGKLNTLSSEVLRRLCPCASCREERGEDPHSGIAPVISKPRSMLSVVKNSAEESLKLNEIWGVGNYAIGLRWGDGHSSGIYTFEYLEKISVL